MECIIMSGLRLFLALTAASVTLASSCAHAVIRSWPGIAPCAGTLQACIDASAAADTVQIVTNAPITQSLFLPRSITLEGGVGFSAQMATGMSIEGNSTDDNAYNVTVRRVALTNARIMLSHNRAGTANIQISRTHIVSTSASSIAGIGVNITGGTATVRISDNRLRVATPGLFDYAIRVGFVGGNSSALIDFNQLQSVGDGDGWGIFADATSAAMPEVTIINNEVRGRYSRGAIGISEGLFSSTASTVTARVVGNAVLGRRRQGTGIMHVINNGTINTRVINNTVVGTLFGAIFSRWNGGAVTGTISGPVTNNLIAHNDRGLSINPEYQTPIVEDYNLIFDNVQNTYTPGAHDVTSNPLLRSGTDLRLQPGSPAINVAASLSTLDAYVAADVGVVDADGLRRIKAVQADIGAYEFGDFSLHPRADAPSGNYFVIAPVVINDLNITSANARLFTTANAGSNAEPPLITDKNPTGVWYLNTAGNENWRIFNQVPTGAAMPVGAEFNVFIPSDGNGTFVHTANVGNTSAHVTTINNSALNNLPNRIVLATANYNPGGVPGIYNPHTISVGYFGSSWFVLNNDFANMPVGAAFNIYAQDPSPNAYVHAATSANASGANATVLDHPLLNGIACAQLYVTPRSGGQGDTTFDVYFNAASQRWITFNHNGVVMPVGAQFNIVIDAGQVAACNGVLFGDGFED
jgi:hypothetical protein